LDNKVSVYGTEFCTFKSFVDYVDLKWLIYFYEVVFRGNNEHTLLCCTQIATQYTTPLYEPNFPPRNATTKATA